MSATSLVCELTLTILPARFSIMRGASAWASRNGARRLIAMIQSQLSTLASRMLSIAVTPALLTRISIAPHAWSAVRAAFCGPSTVARSASMARQRRPIASTEFLISDRPARSRATAAISAPASASTRQISLPMPLEAPVTSAVLPVSEKRCVKSGIASPSNDRSVRDLDVFVAVRISGDGRDDLSEESVEIVAMPGPAGRRTFVGRHDRREFEARHDVQHLPAIAPTVFDRLSGDLPREPAIAVAIAGVARGCSWRP